MNDFYLKVKEDGTFESVSANETIKHSKGLLFDSLAFRYMKAREAEKQLEITEGKIHNEKFNWKRIIDHANESYTRDLIKFLDLLDEAVGEHD